MRPYLPQIIAGLTASILAIGLLLWATTPGEIPEPPETISWTPPPPSAAELAKAAKLEADAEKARQLAEDEAKRTAIEREAVAREKSAASPPQEVGPSEGTEFVATYLEKLDGFKNDTAFHRLGFGRGGPYYKWLDEVGAKRKSNNYPMAQRIALGDLETLGMEYMKTRGIENDYTRFSRESILRALP